MKVVILAGGRGSRISEHTAIIPKPLINIGNKPILWHIMNHYSNFGFNEFVICLGYLGYTIKDYFARYYLHQCDVTIDLTGDNQIDYLNAKVEPWKVSLVDTGMETNTAGRLRRIGHLLKDEVFMLTYGDGLSNLSIPAVLSQHNSNSYDVTLTAVKAPGRYGAVSLNGTQVSSFVEKAEGRYARINGGYFVVNSRALSYINSDNESWEYDILPRLADENKVGAYLHDGFWYAMDTVRDHQYLEELYGDGSCPAPWTNPTYQ